MSDYYSLSCRFFHLKNTFFVKINFGWLCHLMTNIQFRSCLTSKIIITIIKQRNGDEKNNKMETKQSGEKGKLFFSLVEKCHLNVRDEEIRPLENVLMITLPLVLLPMEWNGVTNVHRTYSQYHYPHILWCDPFLIRRSENTRTLAHSLTRSWVSQPVNKQTKRNEHMYLVPYYINKHTNNRFGLLMLSVQLIFYSFVAHFWRPQFLNNNYSTTATILWLAYDCLCLHLGVRFFLLNSFVKATKVQCTTCIATNDSFIFCLCGTHVNFITFYYFTLHFIWSFSCDVAAVAAVTAAACHFIWISAYSAMLFGDLVVRKEIELEYCFALNTPKFLVLFFTSSLSWQINAARLNSRQFHKFSVLFAFADFHLL